jgi:hypothetical protein
VNIVSNSFALFTNLLKHGEKKNMKKSLNLLLLAAAFLSAQLVGAQEKPIEKAPPDHIMIMPNDLGWKDGPASLPKGIQFVVLEGDPTKPGPFTMRLKVPANYKVPPHWHPAIEHVTVVSGTFYMGLGDAFDEAKATPFPAGGFIVMQIGTRHFAYTREEATIQLHGIGPWGINYVNPADDPRIKTQ